MKRFMSVLLSTTMVLTAVPVSVSLSPVVEVSADDTQECQVDVTDYTYEITPILAPFGSYIYVKTDNPDPFSFQFVDYDSVYIDDDSYDDHATYEICPVRFEDVKYENDDSFRVNDGYIFYNYYSIDYIHCNYYNDDSDGGELILMQATGKPHKTSTYTWGKDNCINIYQYTYKETDTTVEAPEFVNYLDYLIKNYTTDDMGFFEKLDAVSNALGSMAIYPYVVYDYSQPTGVYPYLAVSPYKELLLNEHYNDVYERTDGTLLSKAYPYFLDSQGFPLTIAYVALELDDSVEVSAGSAHHLRNITYNGETIAYGGSGNGGNSPVYTDFLEVLFTFDGSDGDYASEGTIENYISKMMEYKKMGNDRVAELMDLIETGTFRETIQGTGGTWIRVADELSVPSEASNIFAYVVPDVFGNAINVVSDAWVDGRYIGEYEYMESATFEEHPTADIVVSDFTYVDVYGNEHTQDVIFEYDSDTETWIAEYWFHGYYDNIPDEFILTADEVDDMDLDSENGIIPESGLIYDGTEYPGTEFTNILVAGIEADEKVEITVGRSTSFDYTVIPESATYTSVSYSSDDSDIAYVDTYFRTGELLIYGVGIGTTTITLTTQEGGYQTTIDVTVVDHIYSGDFVFDKIDDTSVVLVDYTGMNDEIVVVPSEVEGYQVIGIDSYAFCNCDYLSSIVLPDSITEIGFEAFYNCNSLSFVKLPDSITEIDDEAFSYCDDLEKIALPSGLTCIGSQMFDDCYNLTSIWLPESLASIEYKAFGDCYNLTDIYFEGTEEKWNAITIENDNEYLTSATVHYNSSSSIFSTEIEIQEEVELSVGISAVIDYTIIPENATYTRVICVSDDSDIAYAYWEDDGKIRVYARDIGSTTITITSEDCASQTKIKVTVTDEIYEDDFVFAKVGNSSVVLTGYTGIGENIVIPSEIEGYQVVGIYEDVFYGKNDISTVIVPEGVTYIGDYAFSYCYSLENISLPESLTKIGDYAFMCCPIENITLSKNIIEIGEEAFGSCDSIKSITLSSGMTNIEVGTFGYCRDLSEIWIPSSVTNIEERAFCNCSDLVDIYFEGTEEEWKAIIIGEDNECLTSATIHFNSSAIPSVYTLGDINDDGFIDYLDAMIALRYDAELVTLDDAQTSAGDVNSDGSVDSLDAILILRYDAGLIDTF